MLKKIHIAIIVGIATAIWAGVLSMRGLPVTISDLGSFSLVVSGTFVAVWLFDRFAWPCRVKGWCVFHGWLIACPDIRGTWEVDVQSLWLDPESSSAGKPIKCYYGIRQSSSTLHMHLMTTESDSWLLVHRFVPSSKTDGYKLIAVYANQPQIALRGMRSEIHYGTIVLEFHGEDSSHPQSFTGEYWTDRGTKGTITGTRKSRRVISKHAEGVALI